MGCFLSSTKKTPPNPNTKQSINHRPPPLTPPFLEEETIVKEVLSSETPAAKIPNKPIFHTHANNNNNPETFDDQFSVTFQQKQKHHHHDSVLKIAKIFNPLEQLSHEPFDKSIRVGSDPKEIRELGRSIRVGSGPSSILVGSDPRAPPRDVGTALRQRSPAQCRNISPARRSEQSPGRAGSGPRRNSGGLSKIENSGESLSFRGSRSPIVMCGENDGTRNSISRCPSARKTGKSLGRVRSELGDGRRRIPVERNGSYRENYKRSLTSGNNESLENPLVSMECFIFL